VAVRSIVGDRSYRSSFNLFFRLRLLSAWRDRTGDERSGYFRSDRSEFSGELAIQTMMLMPWDELTRSQYIRWIQAIAPDEIQLNTPSRPKPLQHELEARGNHSIGDRLYPVRTFRQVSVDAIREFADEIYAATEIPVRHPPIEPSSAKSP
jgi:hypothetical protein